MGLTDTMIAERTRAESIRPIVRRGITTTVRGEPDGINAGVRFRYCGETYTVVTTKGPRIMARPGQFGTPVGFDRAQVRRAIASGRDASPVQRTIDADKASEDDAKPQLLGFKRQVTCEGTPRYKEDPDGTIHRIAGWGSRTLDHVEVKAPDRTVPEKVVTVTRDTHDRLMVVVSDAPKQPARRANPVKGSWDPAIGGVEPMRRVG